METRTLAAHDAELLGAPFKVILENAVKQSVCAECDAVLKTAIPDPEGLVYAVVVARALHPRKMTGAEIRFIRHAMKWKAKEVAAELGISPEHLSRCENGSLPMSETTERLFRVYSILQVRDRSAVDKLIDQGFKKFRIEASWDADDPLVFHFERRKVAGADRSGEDGTDGKWEPHQAAA